MSPRSLAVVVSSLGFGFGCGQAPTRETPTPTPAPPSLTTFAYAETDVPGTLRVFDVDDQTGALRTTIDVTPSGTEQAPVVSPGSFAVDPNGRLLPRGREPVDGLDGLSVHPFGTFLYASLEDGSLRGYSIDPSTGALSDIGLGARGRRLQFARVPATTGRGGA